MNVMISFSSDIVKMGRTKSSNLDHNLSNVGDDLVLLRNSKISCSNSAGVLFGLANKCENCSTNDRINKSGNP